MADYSDLMKLEKKVKQPLPSVVSSNFPTSMDTPTPASLLANQQTSKEARKQTDLPVNQLTSEEANQQTRKEERKQTDKLANQQPSKQLKKFGSYLREESIKSLKQIAVLTDRKDYEVLQDAVDFFLHHNDKR